MAEWWRAGGKALQGGLRHARNGSLFARIRYGKSSGRTLVSTPRSVPATKSAWRLNTIASAMAGCHSYLEIGLCFGDTFEDVNVPVRVGVDPAVLFRKDRLPSGATVFEVESDTYFTQLVGDQRFNLVFLDGLHEWEQTYRDLLHALDHLEDHAVLLMDDVVPDCSASASPNQQHALIRRRASGDDSGAWHGDVYKVIAVIRQFHPELHVRITGDHSREDNPQAVIWLAAQGATDPPAAVDWEQVRMYASAVTFERYLEDIVPSIQVSIESELDLLETAAKGQSPGLLGQ